MQTRYCGFILVLALIVGAAAAGEGVPVLPQEFTGSLTIGGSPAPAGTEIVALIGGELCGSVTTSIAGRYGGSSAFEGHHLVVGGFDNQVGKTIVFQVNGKDADQTAIFTPSVTTQLDLSIASASAPTASVPSSGADDSSSSSDSSSTVVVQTSAATAASTTETTAVPTTPSSLASSVDAPETTATVAVPAADVDAPTAVIATFGQTTPSTDESQSWPIFGGAAAIVLIGLAIGGALYFRKRG